MLRKVLLGIGFALISLALGLAIARNPAAIGVAIPGLVLVLGILFERHRYKPNLVASPKGAGWQRSEERFVDPASAQRVSVFVNPATGERAYVRDDANE